MKRNFNNKKTKKFIAACSEDDISRLSKILESGMDVSVYDNLAMRIAISKNYMDVMMLLLLFGADINFAMTYASRYGYINAMKLFVEREFDISQCVEGFLSAVSSGEIEIVKLYIEKNVDVKANNNAAIIEAVARMDYKMAELLLKSGAYASARNNESLRRAFKNGDQRMIKILYNYGATVKLLNEI